MEVVVTYIETSDAEVTMVSIERLPQDAVSAMNIQFAGKQSYSGIVIVKDKTTPDDRRPDTIRRYTTFMQQKNQSGDSHRVITIYFDDCTSRIFLLAMLDHHNHNLVLIFTSSLV